MPSSRFANFTDRQYMYVFAISLPYTNPHKYDHYTVSLAHHVIAGWFLNCRLSSRKNFVNYILKGFISNVQVPFQDMKRVDFAAVNEDSSNRKRSSSLTERGSKNRERPSLQHLSIKSDEAADEAVYNFHMELAETCIDFLARHTYSSCSALPKRSSTTDFLLAGGQSMSWLVGHNIVTITTSCCSSMTVRNGLCDRCAKVCKTSQAQLGGSSPSNGATSPDTTSSKTSDSDLSQNKRYTKASLQHNSGQDSESTEAPSTSSSMTPNPPQTDSSGKFFRQPSHEGRFSNSSGSLEALSRRGSNPSTSDNTDTAGKRDPPSYISPQQSVDQSKQMCICSCSGWTEMVIRRPTGNMSFVMRIQNQISLDSLSNEVSLQDLMNMFMPSLGGIYLSADPLVDKMLWDSDTLTFPEQYAIESNKKKTVVVDVPDTKAMDDDGKLDNGSITQAQVPHASTVEKHSTSFPIDIPKSSLKHKSPSGSYSDTEEDDSRSRKPVRRSNSSPEMGSNWRHQFLSQRTSTGGTLGPSNSTHASNEDETVAGDSEQQQKKKNFGKDTRVSCEAIPEEIADSVPLQPTPPATTDSHTVAKETANAKAPTKVHYTEIGTKTNATTSAQNPSASLPTSRGSSTTTLPSDSLQPVNNTMPRKQHSADDALQQRTEQSQSSSSTSTQSSNVAAKGKLNIDMPKLTTKPPQSHAPLSPRLLAKNSAMPSLSSNVVDFPRGRSKTISVMHDNRDNSKTTFNRSKLNTNYSILFS